MRVSLLACWLAKQVEAHLEFVLEEHATMPVLDHYRPAAGRWVPLRAVRYNQVLY